MIMVENYSQELRRIRRTCSVSYFTHKHTYTHVQVYIIYKY